MHDHASATEKAKDLIRMAVSKSRFLEPLENPVLSLVNSALVIGGGVSGITAATDIAQQGFEVHLVEKEAELGGNLRRIQHLPDGTKPKEMLDKMISDLKSYDNVHIHTEATIEDAEGFLGNFKSKIKKKGESAEEIDIEHGVVIVATGAKEYSPKEYKYGEDARVSTQLELEEKIANGEFNADTVVMIQCIGSRNDEFPNCSRVCCTNAISNALEIKKLKPETNVYILNKDIRTFSFKEDYFKEAMESGVIFIRYDDDNQPILNDDFTISINDQVINNDILLKPDLLVLSAGIRANKDNEVLAKLFKLPLSKDKYFLEAHMKLRPVDFSTEGMFLCGLAHSPKFINEAISQASGSVSRACTILSKDHLEVGGVVSEVVSDKCVACLTCVRVCPYNVPEINEDGVADIDIAECQGCGICASECPVKAIQLKHYTDSQVMAKSKALFMEEA
jgi:heterodisulfide reductase subunit A